MREMTPLGLRVFVSVMLSAAIAIRALRRKSLDCSAAIIGFIVMSIHLATSYRFGALLLVFFFTSSLLTKLGEEKKRSIDADFKEGGQRNWVQVLANSGIASALVLFVGHLTGWEEPTLSSEGSPLVKCLIGGIIGHYACCNGDTWSSEVGMLSESQPRLITTFKSVPKGTNGAVTTTGLLAAAAAGCVIGLTYLLVGFFTGDYRGLKPLLVIPLSLLAGVFGSLIDSVLGATVQYSGICQVRKKVVGKKGPTVKRISGSAILDNNGVNFVSVVLTTFVTAILFLYVF
ncbi:protein PGR [Amborella trichopoda]|nr:protein PGR [Amborella trichopoda]|eukprot:XP_006829614.2 protein PGR [Amborella trichopoda]